jgi:glycosidase
LSPFLLAATTLLLALLPGTGAYPGPEITRVPSWAKEAIWYQIFPDRFRNGDETNDPRVEDIMGSWPHETPKEWHVSSWTGDWYELQPWERTDSKGFYYRVQQRRYGGDLQGVLDRLEYLRDLGVNAIYFNPIFESPSLHKYDATMFHHIDNNFGPDPEGDRRIWASEDPADPSTWKWTSADRLFLNLIARAHELGIRVVIDGVFNHVGITFWAFKDLMEQGERSPYKDWFIVKRWDDPSTTENEFEYAGWYGVRELPELREDGNGLVEGPRRHVRHIVERWMDPNRDGNPEDGIDGWRLDVAEMVDRTFWREFRTWVRSINPEAYLVGEVWWENWEEGKMYDASPWLQGDVFDAVMNYRWAREVGHFFKDRKKKTTATEFDRRLSTLREDYRSDVNYVLMNLMDSHDTDRLPSQIVNVDSDYDKRVSARDNPDYDVRKPNPDEIRTQKLILLFQMTTLGAPMVYYGDESGMWGGDDPDERKPMLWDDMQYANERHHPHGKSRPDDVNAFDADLHAHYRTMIHLRRDHKALRLGTIRTVLTDDGNDVYAFIRSHGGEHVLVVINNGPERVKVTLPLGDTLSSRPWRTLFSFTGRESLESGDVAVLERKSALILGLAE